MSPQLPPQPNLEYLKKQAKALLRRLQQENRELQLADAQHTLAREYGFASWPKLQAHVLSWPRAHPFAGSWIANLTRSKRHPAHPFRSARLVVEVAGDTVTISDVVVDESGKEERHTNALCVDGQEHAQGGSGYSLLASWRGSRILETVGKKDGQVIGRGTYEVSADGSTMTISSAEQVIVLDRE
jgi:hypothetical protein